MPIISDRVEIERKPKLGGGGPGKIPYRRGYGGGDDGDHQPPEAFRSRNQRMRRYRIRINPGDRIKVELSPYDLTRGRIVYRER